VAEPWKLEMCPADCGAQIIWALDSQVKRIPVDAEASPEGNLQLSVRWDGELRALVPSKKLAFGLRTLRLDHRKTCTELGQFKRLTGL